MKTVMDLDHLFKFEIQAQCFDFFISLKVNNFVILTFRF